jgi:hypothetical protein
MQREDLSGNFIQEHPESRNAKQSENLKKQPAMSENLKEVREKEGRETQRVTKQ